MSKQLNDVDPARTKIRAEPKPVPERVAWYGHDAPLPEQVQLRAGPLSMLFENGDLRYITIKDREAVRRIYAAARDTGWRTAKNVLSDLMIDARADSFDISYMCLNQLNDIDFAWQGRIAGRADGTVTFDFDGVARANFLRNRLGFCVLHPDGLNGQRARIEQEGGVIDARLPARIAPQRALNGRTQPMLPFAEMRALSVLTQPGVWVRTAFEGDVFESEDQRNWIDGSFKTYCTPLRLPMPVEVKTGTRVAQRITLSVDMRHAAMPGWVVSTRAKVQDLQPEPKAPRFGIKPRAASQRLPAIGVCVARSGQTVRGVVAERLRALKLAHVRVDLSLWQDNWRDTLTRAVRDAAALKTKLEVALFVSDNAEAELAAFAHTALRKRLPIARHLIFHRDHGATPAAIVAIARKQLGAKAVLFCGSNIFFTDLNRNRPDAKLLKQVAGLVYAVNPQAHASDNLSINETPAALGETVRTAHGFAKGRAIAVGAITLKPRHALGNFPGPESLAQRGEFDPRHTGLFGAGWALASLANLIRAGASSSTWFETMGPRGLLDGRVTYPLYHVFADIAEFGGAALDARSSAPLAVEGLVLRRGKRLRVLLANLTPQPQRVALTGLTASGRLKILDATVYLHDAAQRPSNWRARLGINWSGDVLELPPHAYARLDSTS